MFKGIATNSELASSNRKHYTVFLGELDSVVYMYDFRTGTSSTTWWSDEGDIIEYEQHFDRPTDFAGFMYS